MELPIPQNIVPLDNILPDEPLLMMGAGPVPIPARVAAANGIVINHLGDTMSQIIEQVKVMSRYVFQTQNGYILGVAGPGSAAMEMAVANIIVPGMKVLNICNGFFSNRLWEMSDRIGADTVKLQVEDTVAVTPEQVEEYIITHKPDVITIVQGETSNTVCNHQLPEIAAIAKRYGCFIIVDAVCTLSTMPLKMDEWGVDAVITGGQKGLSCIPGISLVGFSEAAWEHIQSRTDKLKHWCLDAKLADQFWNKKSYHYTAPVSGILAIHEALRLICIETLPIRFERHKRCSQALQNGIEAMGLELHVQPDSRLNSVVGINVPGSIDPSQLLAQMSTRYRVEISGSFGPNIVRIGQMGEQCRAHNLFRTLHALGSCLKALGTKLNLPTGMAAMEDTLGRANFAE